MTLKHKMMIVHANIQYKLKGKIKHCVYFVVDIQLNEAIFFYHLKHQNE